MEKPKKLYCSKNLFWMQACQDPYCGGPEGRGVEESCLKNCSNAYTDLDELAKAIGEYVLDKQGVRYP